MMTLDEAISVTEHSAWLGANSVEIDAWSIIKNHLSQPQPVAQGAAVAWRIDWDTGPDCGSRVVVNEPYTDKLIPRGYRKTPLYATPTIPTGHRVVPVDLDDKYREIARLIGSIFFYGDFKAETYNERELEKLLRSTDNFYETEEQALAASPSAGGV